jgi:hypothetical protein
MLLRPRLSALTAIGSRAEKGNRTRWRSGVDSNCRFRWFGPKTVIPRFLIFFREMREIPFSASRQLFPRGRMWQ